MDLKSFGILASAVCLSLAGCSPTSLFVRRPAPLMVTAPVPVDLFEPRDDSENQMTANLTAPSGSQDGAAPDANFWKSSPAEKQSKGSVVLTFDDGPSPWTAQLIQALDNAHVPAVFFWNTYHIQYADSQVQSLLKKSPDISIGDHTIDHANLSKLSYTQQFHEIDGAKQIIQQTVNQSVYYFRPPYGSYNQTTALVLKQDHLQSVMWDVDSLDWKYNDNEAAILKTIRSELHSGAIILLHDHYDTIKFLPDIIAMIRHDGYQFTDFAR